MFEDFLTAAAEYMGTTATNTGIVLALLVSLTLILIVAIATKGAKFEIVGLLMGLFTTVLFTAMNWYPLWTGSVIALMIALLSGWYFSKMGGKE